MSLFVSIFADALKTLCIEKSSPFISIKVSWIFLLVILLLHFWGTPINLMLDLLFSYLSYYSPFFYGLLYFLWRLPQLYLLILLWVCHFREPPPFFFNFSACSFYSILLLLHSCKMSFYLCEKNTNRLRKFFSFFALKFHLSVHYIYFFWSLSFILESFIRCLTILSVHI